MNVFDIWLRGWFQHSNPQRTLYVCGDIECVWSVKNKTTRGDYSWFIQTLMCWSAGINLDKKSHPKHVIKIHWILPYFNTLELQPFSPFYALFSYIQHVVCSAWAKVLCFFFNFIYWYSYFAGAPGVITGITLGVTYPDKYRLHNM